MRLLQIILFIFAMAFNLFSSASKYPDAVITIEDDFVDIALSISSFEKTDDGIYVFKFRNKINNKKIGFDAFLETKWKEHEVKDADLVFYWSNAHLKSIGVESDNFLNELASLYDAETSNLTFHSKINAEIVMLSGGPDSIETQPFRLKFFFNSEGSEDLYSEIFINFDVKSNTAEFNEKDIEYRAPLLRSLSK